MKKKHTAPEQHPVDAFFREQEPGIPVAFEPAHWDALQAMLDQASPGHEGIVGVHVSDAPVNSARPSLARLFGAVLIFVFLVAVLSTDTPTLSQSEVSKSSLSFSPETPSDQPVTTDSGAFVAPEQDVPHTLSHTERNARSLKKTWTFSAHQALKSGAAGAADTLSDLRKTVPFVPDSLSRRIDSLSLRKSPQAPRDSTTEKRKKKHLFW